MNYRFPAHAQPSKRELQRLRQIEERWFGAQHAAILIKAVPLFLPRRRSLIHLFAQAQHRDAKRMRLFLESGGDIDDGLDIDFEAQALFRELRRDPLIHLYRGTERLVRKRDIWRTENGKWCWRIAAWKDGVLCETRTGDAPSLSAARRMVQIAAQAIRSSLGMTRSSRVATSEGTHTHG